MKKFWVTKYNCTFKFLYLKLAFNFYIISFCQVKGLTLRFSRKNLWEEEFAARFLYLWLCTVENGQKIKKFKLFLCENAVEAIFLNFFILCPSSIVVVHHQRYRKRAANSSSHNFFQLKRSVNPFTRQIEIIQKFFFAKNSKTLVGRFFSIFEQLKSTLALRKMFLHHQKINTGYKISKSHKKLASFFYVVLKLYQNSATKCKLSISGDL